MRPVTQIEFSVMTGAVLGGLALKIDSDLDVTDAALTGAVGLWAVGYFVANLLAPIAAFNGPVLWLMLGAGSAWLWYRPPRIVLRTPTAGEKLTALAVGVLAVSYLPLQLASPVPPFMDVLNVPSSVQQLLTFHTYLPFHDNPYGVFGAYNRAPALELFYATLAFGSHTHLARYVAEHRRLLLIRPAHPHFLLNPRSPAPYTIIE
jgi:hypothetical protein